MQEIKKIYNVRFKRKDLRENKRDDKVTILKQAISMDTQKVTRREERVFDLNVRGLTGIPDPDKRLIMDFNYFDIPKVALPLSKDQVLDLQKLAEDPTSDVEWIYEDFIPSYEIKELLGSELVPLAPIDDAKTREIITGNVRAMKADRAWTYKKGAGVKVAVMDTGIDKNHPDLRDNFAGGYVAGAGDNSDPGAADLVGHGTSCASIIGAVMSNGQGIAGIAPECDLYSIRVFHVSNSQFVTAAEFQAAILWAGTNKMNVMSMSLGSADPSQYPLYNEPDSWPQWMKDEQSAFTSTYNNGVLMVAAAGNENDGGKPSNLWADRSYPAAYNFIASVTALHPENQFIRKPPHWWGCNTGKSVNLCAPGESDDPGQNQNEKQSDFGMVCRSDTGRRNAYNWFRGTSMATPQVAGVAVLGYSAWKYNPCVGVYDGYPDARPNQNVIARTMAATADGRGASGWPDSGTTQFGWGLPNAERTVKALLNIDDEGNNLQIAAPSLAPTSTNPKPSQNALFI